MPFRDPEAKKAYDAAYREKNRAKLAAKQLERQRAEKQHDPASYAEKVRAKSKGWRERNPGKAKQGSQLRARKRYAEIGGTEEYKLANRARVKAWRDENREKFREKARNRRALRYERDVQFRLEISLRRRLYMAVRNNHRSGLAVRELGCSIKELKTHLERLFAPGMTWDNWGPSGWHIDHIKPLSRFDLTDVEQVKTACHYTNLQPLWWHENVRKDSRKK